VIVTLGPVGALIARRDGTASEVQAMAVQAVDATGAGDAFNGALAAALAQGHDLEASVRRAVAAAGLSTTVAGAREGMPTAVQLEAHLGG
jgi:ribokinase